MEIIAMGWNKAMGYFVGMMALFMKAILRIIIFLDMELINGRMERNTKAIGLIIVLMDKGSFGGMMVKSILERLKIIWGRVKGKLFIRMAKELKGIGKMISWMAREWLWRMIFKWNKNGVMELELKIRMMIIRKIDGFFI